MLIVEQNVDLKVKLGDSETIALFLKKVEFSNLVKAYGFFTHKWRPY